jgi:hypothetical protein
MLLQELFLAPSGSRRETSLAENPSSFHQDTCKIKKKKKVNYNTHQDKRVSYSYFISILSSTIQDVEKSMYK